MNNEPKFCVNCRWHMTLVSHFCLQPTILNLVTGEAARKSCQEMRRFNEPCGPDAKLWEEKV